MQEFDPRQTAAVRLAPPMLAALGGLSVAVIGWQALHRNDPVRAPDLAAARAAQRAAQEQIRASLPPAPVKMLIKVAPGQTLEAAVRQTGVGKDEAQEAVQMLGKAFDTVNIRAGLALTAAITRPAGHEGAPRLMALSLQPDAITTISLSRAIDGALRLNKQQEKVLDQTQVASGRLDDSLYVSAQKAGATPELTNQVIKLFQHKLDFSRDIQPGDSFSLVFNRKVTASGHVVSTGQLLYAELRAKGGDTRLYAFQAQGMTAPQYFDEAGKSIQGLLLRTPLDNVRITSSFGMRLHPILGFTKMHTGIDFGAPWGTPVYAAGDGVVVKAEWANGYGRWLQIRHSGGIDTGYGHLSRWAVRQGEHVHQGQVVAYVGATGRATGPHLHYETIVNGQKVNPSTFKAPAGMVLSGVQLAAFKAEKSRIDGLISQKMASAGGHPGA